jgi:hypothetical protein
MPGISTNTARRLRAERTWEEHRMSTPAGWYRAPEGDGRQRYWDGTAWTEHYAPGAQPAEQPVSTEQPAALSEDAKSANDLDTKGLRPDIANAVKGYRLFLGWIGVPSM